MAFSAESGGKAGVSQSALHQATSSVLSSLLNNPPYLPDIVKSAAVRLRHSFLNLTPDDVEDYLVTDCYPSSHDSTALKTLELLHSLKAQVEQDSSLLSDGGASALISNVRYRCPEPDNFMLGVDLGVHKDGGKPLLTLLLRLEGSPNDHSSYKYDNLLPCDVGPTSWQTSLEEAHAAHNTGNRNRSHSEAVSTASYGTARHFGDPGAHSPSEDTTYLGHDSRKGSEVARKVHDVASDEQQGDYFDNPVDFWAGVTSDEDASSAKPQLDDYPDEAESDDTRRKREEAEEKRYWSLYHQSDSDSKDDSPTRMRDNPPKDSDDEQKSSDVEWYMQRYPPVTESVSGQTMYDVPANMSLGDLERHHRERDMKSYAGARQKARQVLQAPLESGHYSSMASARDKASEYRNVGDPIDDLSFAELDLVVAARRQVRMNDSSPPPQKMEMDTSRQRVDHGEKWPPTARLAGGRDQMSKPRGKGRSSAHYESALFEHHSDESFPQRARQNKTQRKATEVRYRTNEAFLPTAQSDASVMGTMTFGDPNSIPSNMPENGHKSSAVRRSQREDDGHDGHIDEETYEMMHGHLQNQRQQANITRERQQYRQKQNEDRSFHRSVQQDDMVYSSGEEDNDSTQRGSATQRSLRSVDVASWPVGRSHQAGSDRTQNSTVSRKSNSNAPSLRPKHDRASRSNERALESAPAQYEESRRSSRASSGKGSRNGSSRRVASNPKLNAQHRASSSQWRSEAGPQSSTSESDESDGPDLASRRRNEAVKSFLKGAWQLLDESEAPITERSNEEEFMRLAREAMRECVSSKRRPSSMTTSRR